MTKKYKEWMIVIGILLLAIAIHLASEHYQQNRLRERTMASYIDTNATFKVAQARQACERAQNLIDRASSLYQLQDWTLTYTCIGLMHSSFGRNGICPPVSLTVKERISLFLKWADAHPQESDLYFSEAIVLALNEAYPCKL